MARLTRKNIKVFAGNATNNGVFGSLQAENPVTTTNVEQIQSLPAWSVGWNSATMTSENLPPLEEFQGIQYVTTYQQAYLMQEGMPEWASTVTYYKGSLTKEVTANGFRIYCSLTDNNINHLLSDTTNWKKVMDSDDLYAFNNAVVHIAGAETITGTKTVANNANSNFIIQNTQYAYSDSQSANAYFGIDFQDKNGQRIGKVEPYYMGSGAIGMNLSVSTVVNGNISYGALTVEIDANGQATTKAPTPTETTTTTGKQIATTGWVNSTNNNAVHKTGDETIAGNKTFSGNVKLTAQSGSPQSGLFISSDYTTYAVSVQNNSITKGTAPSSNSYCGIDFYGTATTNYANRLGLLEFRYDTDKLTSASLCAFKSNAASDSVSARIAVYYPPTGNPYTEAPASDANNSIVTTVGKNKAQNGYFKLGNGLIIQWGRFTVASGKTSATITFPTAFTSTNYSINCMQNNKDSYRYDGVTSVTSRNTANCTVYSFYDSVGYDWIAIGY